MEHERIEKSPILTADERIMADFIHTRTKKVLNDIRELSGKQEQRLEPWAESFAYLARTYGRDSDETFKWYKYYFREGLIPDAAALPLLVQIYLDSSVDAGFVNLLARAMKKEPETVRAARMDAMEKELASALGEDGCLTVYRGCFEKPFGQGNDASRPIERAFAFTLERDVAKKYACCWFPETAKVYEVRTALTDIAWYHAFDEEKTVILLPKSKGAQWTVAAETIIPASEYGGSQDRVMARQSYRSLFNK